MPNQRFLPLVAAVLLFAACSDSDPTGPEPPGLSARASAGASGSASSLGAPLSSTTPQPAAVPGDSATTGTERGLMFGSGT